ncbi:mobile element protein [Jeotgalibacillus alimentarius]|uniref:Mobile element protein n=1 Tax=Jeotgalibacillus alimentarius TaxID=135826 RepID=A0A0C2VX59_9BACL|nr:mobile element protein [Jeotgalibacillus alimentarius]
MDSREEFGHWEIDTVLGKKSKDEALLTLIERKTRKELLVRISSKSASAVQEAVRTLLAPYQDNCSAVFKSITADNGAEFSELAAFEKENIAIYFSHPYASFERGTNERHNGIKKTPCPKHIFNTI